MGVHCIRKEIISFPGVCLHISMNSIGITWRCGVKCIYFAAIFLLQEKNIACDTHYFSKQNCKSILFKAFFCFLMSCGIKYFVYYNNFKSTVHITKYFGLATGTCFFYSFFFLNYACYDIAKLNVQPSLVYIYY